MPQTTGLPYGARASMEPAGYEIELSVGDGGRRSSIAGAGLAGCEADGARIACSFDGEVLAVSLEALEDVRVESCRVFLRHAFSSDERVLLNGYQSWTDTVERSPWAKMRGLKGVPQAIVKRWTLDGGGDYHIVDYANERGKQHGFTYATFRRGEGLVLVGSLDESRGFTLIGTDAGAGHVVVQPECPNRRVLAGERVRLASFAIVRGTRDDVYSRWFALSGVTARTRRPLVGYTSWYRHYGDIDERKLAADLAGTAAQLGPIDGAGAVKLFQIDDGYCKVGDWLDVDAAKFPNGLAPLAQAARAAGLVPGLWAAPFTCERESRLFKEHGDWLLRDACGNPVPTGPHWSGGFALDTRNPDVRSYVLEALQTMVNEWKFGLLKLDFLYSACILAHDGFNRGELMADAVDLLRLGMGETCLFLACGVPLGSVFGKADYCRIGCDVGPDWDDKAYMRPLHRERVSTKNSLANTRFRAPLDGRAFGNDPDVFFLRDDARLTGTQRDELLLADASLGSVFLTSDDMATWSDAARKSHELALGRFLGRFEGGSAGVQSPL